MTISLIIHTESESKLKKLLDLIERHPNKSSFSITLHAKNYTPWVNEELKNKIVSFKTYYAFPTQKEKVESVVELISKTKEDRIIILDEDCKSLPSNLWEINYDSLFFRKQDLKFLNLDTKYKSLTWFILDLISQKKKEKLDYIDDSDDYDRYSKKVSHNLFFQKIIYIDGGMGDHIMALPLLEKVSSEVFVCCKYPFLYEHIPFKGYVNWTDELFGGYSIFVYEFGSKNNSKTIVDAFFEMYNFERNDSDVLKYNGRREENPDVPIDKKTVLICTSAAKLYNQDSNKDWSDIRWFKLIHELKKEGYYVIQVGSKNDNQIPNVDLKFLDRPIHNLAKLIDDCSLWISVDTFFHHFAASIKPNVGVCLNPFYNDHAKHPGVKYIEKDCGKNYSDRKWWLDIQQPERKECMNLIQVNDVLNVVKKKIRVKIYCGNINFDNCANWRGYMQYKNIEGIDFEITNVLDFNINKDIKYDVVMMIRPLNGLIDYIRQLKSNGIKVIVDYDDSLPLSFDPQNIIPHITEVIQIMNECDGITTTTEKLKNYYYYHSFNENINIIPNIIDTDVVTKNKKNNGDKIILGWFGNSGHYDNLILINESVLKILNDYDNVYLNVYSDSEKIFELFEHPKTNKINYLFDFKTFQENLGDIDINLAPMVDSYFNLHKSNIRIILPGYKGIPSIASNFSEYKDLGDNVILCDKKEDWYDGIKSLIDDETLRKKIGHRIQNYVEKNLTIDVWKNIKYEMFNSIVNKK